MNTIDKPQGGSVPVAKRPRALTSKQLWRRIQRPLARLEQNVAAALKEGKGSFQAEVLVKVKNHLDEARMLLWREHEARALAEAKAKDRGVICWTVYHPVSPQAFFRSRRVVVRTPNTIQVLGEYFTLPDVPPRVTLPGMAYTDLRQELDRDPLDLDAFRIHLKLVEADWRKRMARGCGEGVAA